MKTSFQRLPPKIRHYRDYSNYSNIMFRVSLFNELSKLNIEAIDLHKFITVCIGTLNNHAPSKKKYIRDNHLPFMNKELSEKIMHKKRLWKNFLTLFPLRYLGPLYHFGGGGKITPHPRPSFLEKHSSNLLQTWQVSYPPKILPK